MGSPPTIGAAAFEEERLAHDEPGCDRVWRRARLATLDPRRPGIGEIDDGVIACRTGVITYAGPASEAPAFGAAEVVDCEGRWITPGLIDCHTHLVWGGDRAGEFEARLAGASYEAIARAGGGILSTVAATRAAGEESLTRSALARLDALLAEGVTTVEVKSGYGLSTAEELKLLRVARGLADRRDVAIVATFLGAHALPREYAGDPDGYIDLVCREMIPAVAAAGLADAVDAFCETIGFTPDQTARVFAAAAAAERFPSSCTPTSFPTSTAPPWPRGSPPCRPIIWSTWARMESRPWRRPASSPPFFRVRSISSVKRRNRRSRPCAPRACPWRWPPTATREPRPSPPSCSP